MSFLNIYIFGLNMMYILITFIILLMQRLSLIIFAVFINIPKPQVTLKLCTDFIQIERVL